MRFLGLHYRPLSTALCKIYTSTNMKMKRATFTTLFIGILLPLLCFGQPALQVSENGRYLVTAEGKPFFWMGDTAWELFHRLDREEADRYLENRKAKGFTVIQAVALAQLGSLEEPNAYGNLPLAGNDPDPTKPVEAYFAHVDYIVEKAASLGLYIGFLPTWGAYWQGWNSQGIFTPQNARSYGEFLGKRYKDQSNIIWILGGDSNPETEEHYKILEAMAEGQVSVDGSLHQLEDPFFVIATENPVESGLSVDSLKKMQLSLLLKLILILPQLMAKNHLYYLWMIIQTCFNTLAKD